MNLLVIGSGGREHALVWKLAQSPRWVSERGVHTAWTFILRSGVEAG